ncbi:DNA-directed RNA polymerase III subunit RPC5-like [Trifolium pratense]|nr:DNA-directed RNA polymerase III subunit RPC5-like [Trifolium pratense]
MDFDYDDDDLKPPVTTSRRFAPKASKLKPKKEPQLVPKPEPPSTKTEPQEIDLTVKQNEVEHTKSEPNGTESSSNFEAREDDSRTVVSTDVEMTEAVQDFNHEVVPMDEEDTVVREIDVYFSPSIDDETKLYVMQYPLRPSWRPYELEENCEEIRLKPKTSEVQVDLSVDLESSNIDRDNANGLNYTKQTLSTTWKPPPANGCAVGLLMGDKLHLHPVHAVVQLRPSRHYLDSGKVATSKTQNKQTEPSSSSSIEEKSDGDEGWVPLKYHGCKDDISSRYFQQMVAHKSSPINFEMSTYDYIGTICPGGSSNALAKGPSKRYLLSLPVEKRLQTFLIQGLPLHRFSAIKHFAPEYSDDELLSFLQNHALLLRGYWVPKGKLLYPEGGIELLARNFVLVSFNKSLRVQSGELRKLGGELANRVKYFLMQFALEKLDLKEREMYWKFKELPDESFIKDFPIVVKQQEEIYKILEREVSGFVSVAGKQKQKSIKNAVTTSGVNSALVRSTNSDPPATSLGEDPPPRNMTMSSETRHALPIALKKLFQTHKVCSFQLICQELRGLALAKTMLPKGGSKIDVDAANSLDVPQDELKAVLGEVACDIHGCFVLKSSKDDLFRDVVIDMLRGSGPNGKLRKAEILEAARRKLGRDVPNTEYIKAVSELCISKGSYWVLKSGDGSKQ